MYETSHAYWRRKSTRTRIRIQFGFLFLTKFSDRGGEHKRVHQKLEHLCEEE